MLTWAQFTLIKYQTNFSYQGKVVTMLLTKDARTEVTGKPTSEPGLAF
jgi:hypothetical protein